MIQLYLSRLSLAKPAKLNLLQTPASVAPSCTQRASKSSAGEVVFVLPIGRVVYGLCPMFYIPIGVARRKIRRIESNVKCRYLKKLTGTGTLPQVFYLSEALSPPMTPFPPPHTHCIQAGSWKMNTALEYSTRVVQEGGRRCKKSTLNDLVHLTPLRIPLMNPPYVYTVYLFTQGRGGELIRELHRGAIVHKAGRKYQHDVVYLQSINSTVLTLLTTFRVWCLYS